MIDDASGAPRPEPLSEGKTAGEPVGRRRPWVTPMLIEETDAALQTNKSLYSPPESHSAGTDNFS